MPSNRSRLLLIAGAVGSVSALVLCLIKRRQSSSPEAIYIPQDVEARLAAIEQELVSLQGRVLVSGRSPGRPAVTTPAVPRTPVVVSPSEGPTTRPLYRSPAPLPGTSPISPFE